MPGAALPNFGLIAGWLSTENTWGGPMNQNLRFADLMIAGAPIIDMSLTAPPGAPAEGDAFICAPASTGAWAGEDLAIARWYALGAVWEFKTPKANWVINNAADGRAWRFDGAIWIPITGTVNTQVGAAYTLAIADAAALVQMNNAAANVCTVPPNSAVPFPINTEILVAQMGAGVTTLAAGAGVTLLKPSTLAISAKDGVARLLKTAINTWRATGNLT
jgi:hypothetical protein